MKIVINADHGGFGLSALAMKRYAELSGKEIYFVDDMWKEQEDAIKKLHKGIIKRMYRVITLEEANKQNHFFCFTRPDAVEYLNLNDEPTLVQNDEIGRRWKECRLDDDDIKRDDPFLVQVVEELGKDADGFCATLKVVEVPDGIDWCIDEYDGSESVEESHRSWQ